jgi:hypothetical protein
MKRQHLTSAVLGFLFLASLIVVMSSPVSAAGAITKVGSTQPTVTHASTSSVTPAWDSGSSCATSCTAGHLLIGHAYSDSGTATTTATTGWTLVKEAVQGTTPATRVSLWYKIAAGGDAAPTFSDAGAVIMEAYVEEFQGNSSTPLQSNTVAGATGTAIATVTEAASPSTTNGISITSIGWHLQTGATSTETPGTGWTASAFYTASANGHAGGDYKLNPSTSSADSELPVEATGGTINRYAAVIAFFGGPAPAVTSISPHSGTVTGGTTITVNGSGFTGATAVNFGSTAGTSLNVVSDTQITVNSPANSMATAPVDVTVVTPAGTSPTSSADKFGYIDELIGLLDRQGIPANYRSTIGGYVVNGHDAAGLVGWNELVKSDGTWAVAGDTTDSGYLVPAGGNFIDQAITDTRNYNTTNGTHKSLKVRIVSGQWSFADAVADAGSYTEHINGVTVPDFWTTSFQTDWQSFASFVASHYDGVPEIGEITMSGEDTIGGEPMIHELSDSTTRANMYCAGYRTTTDETQQEDDSQFLTGLFTFTRFAYTFNPYQTLTFVSGTCPSVTTSMSADLTQTQSFITEMRADSPGIALENNSLRDTYVNGTGNYQTMYSDFATAGSNLSYQTATCTVVGDIDDVVRAASGAVESGDSSIGTAHDIELPKGYDVSTSTCFINSANASTYQALFS